MTQMDNFESMPSRIVGELADRLLMASKALRFHHGFLDDILRGILPHDLILIGAPSGVGKTDLALSIAASNAFKKRRVCYFALEAEPLELERRTKFALLSRECHRVHHPLAGSMNYTDWLLGNCEKACGEFNGWADQQMLECLGSLRTFYRGAKFDADDLRAWILKIYAQTDLIIIDHLHYIDSDDKENEARGLGETVKTIRDVSLRIGKPIILVAHLRKRDQRAKQIVASLDDFHGSSNIVKICTQAIAFEHAAGIDATKWFLSPTFMTVLKDRRAGATGFVAVTQFDRRVRGYADNYTLGRIKESKWEQISPGDRPGWAHHHEQMEAT